MAYEMTWFERACELAYNREFEELFKHVEKWNGILEDAPHLKKGLTHVDGLPVSSVGDTHIDALLKLCVRKNCTEQKEAVYNVIGKMIHNKRIFEDVVFHTRMTLLCAGAFDGDVDLIEFVCVVSQYSDDQKRKLYLRMLDSAAKSENDSDAKSVFEWLCASRRTHFRGISLVDGSYDQRLLNVFTRVLSAECTDSADFLLTHSVHLGFNPFLMQSSHVQALVCDLMHAGATKSLDFLCSRSATHPTEFDKELTKSLSSIIINKEFIVKTVKEYALSYEKTHFDFAYRDKINNWLQEKEEPSRKRKA